MSALSNELKEQIRQCGVIAVLVIDRVEDGVPLAHALLDGGVNVMELTLRTPAAVGALKAIKAQVPEMTAGIGTILTPDQVREVSEAGAAFGVAPGLNPRVVKTANECGLAFSPGVATPSEIEMAVEMDCKVLKFFPAEPMGGLKYLDAVAAPYAHLGLQFMPLGGVNAQNLESYLGSKHVLAIGGSWIAKRDAIADHDWASITRNAREAVDIVKNARG